MHILLLSPRPDVVTNLTGEGIDPHESVEKII